MKLVDNLDDPDGINAYLDEASEQDDGSNVVPFRVPVRTDRADLPIIKLDAGELHNIATEAESALLASVTPFYVRGERLVRPVTDEVAASGGRRTKVARLSEVTEAAMIDRLSRSAEWQKYDGRKKGYVVTDPTPKVAAIVLSRDGEWRFPKLSGVITTPTLRPDGTILSEPGYDPETRLLLVDPPAMPAIPAKPSRKRALAALAFLDELLDEFPFVDAPSRSVALSALITPVVRGAVSVSPMHSISAPVPGSGKSYIVDLASAISGGEKAPVLTVGRNEEETEKRLVASILTGQTIVSIDNVNGELGGDFLCQMIERPVVAVRKLGTSDIFKVESRATTFSTGNNILLLGDMTRRVILCSLDPNVERPELRTFSGSPFDRVLEDRGKYVAAALTVVRAYVVAGYPGMLPALASFEDWSRLVRSALAWLDRPDPCETMERARADDPVMATLTGLMTAWHEAVGPRYCLAAEIKDAALAGSSVDGSPVHPRLREAVSEIAERRNGISTGALGKYLAKHQNRIVAGLRLTSREDADTKLKLWKVAPE